MHLITTALVGTALVLDQRSNEVEKFFYHLH